MYKKRIGRRQRGQALTEYALLMVFAVAIAMGFYKSFNRVLSAGSEGFNGVLENELMSGGFAEAESLWEN